MSESQSASLEVLLIEDNPGDARLIEELLTESDELAERLAPEADPNDSPTLYHESRLEDGLSSLESGAPTQSRPPDPTALGRPTSIGEPAGIDVVLLDLNLPDSTGLDTLTAVMDCEPVVPVIVLTGVRDNTTGIEAVSRGAQEYLVKDDVTAPLLVRTIAHAMERHQQQLERERRQAELKALNRLSQIGQEITRDVITTTSREELEQAVCDRLTAEDAYWFVWIGDVGPGGSEIVPRAMAGNERGYLDEIAITVDDTDTGHGPTGRAFRTGEIQVAHNLSTDETFEPWRESALHRSFHASAAIPLIHQTFRYGILNVYASRPNAFSTYEQQFLERLSDVIAHAITALERKEALHSDTMLELEFEVAGLFEPMRSAVETVGGTLELRQFIRSSEDVLAYGSATGISQDALEDAVQNTEGVSGFRVVTPGQTEYDFELVMCDEESLFETVANHGGRITTFRFDDTSCRIIMEVTRRTDTAQLIEMVESICSTASYVAQRTAERSAPTIPDRGVVESKLTGRQLDSLETAYRAGFFDWPRTSTGEEVAERLDISPATFTQHLREAERKFFEAVFSDIDERAGHEHTDQS